MKTSIEAMKKSGLSLAIFAFISVLLVAVTNYLTLDKIKHNNAMRLLATLNEIVPKDAYNNDLANSKITIASDKTGFSDDLFIYFAEKNKQLVTAVFEVSTNKGYSGNITLLVGVNVKGTHNNLTLSSVRAIKHKETPGLGDKMEVTKSDWILGFNGKSLNNPDLGLWKVKKDGGEFDQFTGATITPRAIVNLVRSTLLYAQDNLTNIYNTSKSTRNNQADK